MTATFTFSQMSPECPAKANVIVGVFLDSALSLCYLSISRQIWFQFKFHLMEEMKCNLTHAMITAQAF